MVELIESRRHEPVAERPAFAFGGRIPLVLHRLPAGGIDPGLAPARQVFVRFPVEDLDQRRPGRVAERECFQVLLHAVTERVLADQLLELAHHDRRLVVDDRAVHLAGLVQVRQVLADGVGAVRAIHGISAREVTHEKIEVVVDIRETGVDDLRRHEVRKHFLGPDVIEPLHRDEIAEPHVRGLVGDQAGATQQPGLRRRLVEKQARRTILDRAYVLHPAILERRDQRESEFLVGISDTRVFLQPVE